MRKIIPLCIVILALLPCATQAGQLDDFEEEATEDNRSYPPRYDRSDWSNKPAHAEDCSHPDNRCRTSHLLFDLTGALLEGVISSGAAFSRLRMAPTMATGRRNPYRRAQGEPMLPIARLDLHHQTTDSGLYANDMRLELGYGALGVQGRYTRFVEEPRQDSLDYAQLHALVRLSYTEGLGLNLGAGIATLDGNQYTVGSSLTMPVFLHLTPNIGFEFRPTASFFSGNVVSESDSVLMLSHGAASLNIGYRSLESGAQQISGPYVGLSLRY